VSASANVLPVSARGLHRAGSAKKHDAQLATSGLFLVSLAGSELPDREFQELEA
jgi:hypothetical protein